MAELNLEITEVRVYLNTSKKSNVLAFAKCLINQAIVLDQLKIMVDKKTNQPCVRYPAQAYLDKIGAQKIDKKTSMPVWVRYFYPVDKRADLTIQRAILEKYFLILKSKKEN